MTRIHIITVLTLILLSTGLRAEGDKVRFAYDVDFEMRFDNREYYRSAFSPSMTIFGARLTPSVGLDIYQDRGVSHRLMMGIDVSKDFGASPVSKLLSGGQTYRKRLRNRIMQICFVKWPCIISSMQTQVSQAWSYMPEFSREGQ